MTRSLVLGTPIASWPVRAAKAVVLVLCCTVVVLPFLGVFVTSFASRERISKSGGLVLLPTSFSLDAYRSIFAGGVVTRALVISVFVTLVGTALSLTVTALVAYALSRPMYGAKPMLMLFLVSMLFSAGIIPTYLVVKAFGMINSLWSLIIPTMISAFNVIVMRSFFGNLPQELIESAEIDGASEWNIFIKIVLPLSKAVMAVIGLFYAVGYWNAFFNALLYINDAHDWPVQLVLRTYVINDTQLSSADLGGYEHLPPQPAIQMAILVITIVPILLVYPFLQKHFAKGVLTGAVKG